ncbi:MAG: glucose-1-phosphate cytidylyltransferase [Ignavibacteria bacterium RIFOXYC2_FULL_35_16]|nr:MAG: glucose-1-phosphate cytidylyltransferase [Ignavibacteria bacterium GWF2_35_20]OGU79622.1 MAG: glucose-1-phosphate cytidylyltransferase [Ignavibacteria bacterium RIFOXYA2_FULL_35_9]OGU85769.1 MAG: glucose-1-phosphate cytidylyltransferase [Ignavibacteria bacterium RIFOXYA12_FULL_35_25]OGU93148.1 MAG: glucose-1-phosphate cytidylyltransferase [Ignavibacteria bacterium RIFOXYB12_FULL_35_14]OGU98304.1 MAG: glucose-1-phosphate cytidylyltransferase [Ignavibacteria bacterium RIFOXYC2_FULL_35_16]
MKVLILAGGIGSRLSEETAMKPKPMVEIGENPILWHIMKIYSSYGYNDFIILLGYKGYLIKEYFANYLLHNNDVTIDLQNNDISFRENKGEPWKISLVDTGLDTLTGGRVKRVSNLIGNEPFMLTYGDGVSDLDITKLIDFHKKSGKFITMTAVKPEGRFGILDINPDTNEIVKFAEKPKNEHSWINGGFFVCEPEVLNYIDGDMTIFEREPLENLANEKQLVAYPHPGFWMCMDTIRDKERLTYLVVNEQAPWITWIEQ